MSIIGAILNIAGEVTQAAIAKNQGDTIRELKQENQVWRTRATQWEKENAELRNTLLKCGDALMASEEDKMELRTRFNTACRDRDTYHQQLIGKGFKPLPAGEADDVYPNYPKDEPEDVESP